MVSHFSESAEVPASAPLSDRVSKDLKKRGSTFVDTAIVYSCRQAGGPVDDHLDGCPTNRS